MKFQAVATAVLAAIAAVQARECTASDLSASGADLNTVVNNVEKFCGSAFSTKSTGPRVTTREELCNKPACLSAVDALAKVYPDCDIQGTNYHRAVQQKNEYIQSECKEYLHGSSAATAIYAVQLSTALAVGLAVIANVM